MKHIGQKRPNAQTSIRPHLPRRQFLKGAGSATLAIPFLPSLLSKAFACGPTIPGPSRCFFAIGTDHGNVWGANMYPSDALLSDQQMYAGRMVRAGALPTAADANGRVVLSPVCSASASALTPGLTRKLNILRGVDIPYRISHHLGGHLGNFAATTGGITAGLDNSKFMTPTVDQVMAYAPSFYTAADLADKMTRRSIHIGRGDLSWNYTSPSAKAGNVVPSPAHVRNLDLFEYLFSPGSSLNGFDTFLVDRVKQSYDRLKRHPRLSNGDRLRLDAHVEKVAEIERKLLVVNQLAAPPQLPATDSDVYLHHHSFPHDPVENRLYCGLMNDIIVAAFSAGVTRIGSWHQDIHFADVLIQDWHGQVAHAGFGADVAQGWTVGWNQSTFEHVLVDLASKMDAVITENGSTLLDNSLLLYTQEAGQKTHHSGCVNTPIVTFGGAGGYFNTGNFVDFTNRAVVYDDLAILQQTNPLIHLESPGLYHNQFLANVLAAMGVCGAEMGSYKDFITGAPTPGFGMHYVEPSRANDYVAAKALMSDPMPVITTGA